MDEGIKYERLNVLMTTDTVGGVWTYSMELCKALQPFNVFFYLITTGAPMLPHQREEAAQLTNAETFETDFLLEWMNDPWENIDASGAWLLQLADKLQPGLIHLNAYAYGSLPWKAPVIVVAHSDVFSWWLNVKQTHPPPEWNEYFRRVRAGMHAADYIIAPSRWAMMELRKIYQPETPGKVVYNGRSPGIFHASKKQKSVFSMGRIWDEAKNIRLLADAAPHIPHPVRLAGANSFQDGSCIIPENNVISLGRLDADAIAAELSAASVYVLPAKYEPFGLSVLEAALSGCALVLGNINSLREIWHDCALYVDTNDAPALAKTVNYFLENEEECLSYGQKALEQATAYSTKTMADGYIQVYSRLLRKQNQLISNN